jgi:hypothetical protein
MMMSLFVTAAIVLGAGTYDRIFDTGFAAYQSGDFTAAIQSFEQLIENGVVEPEVFYNLGNAYYRAGHAGPAIANYERALQLQPGLVVARENLMRAVNATERRLSKPKPPAWDQALLFWDDAIGPRTAFWCAALAWMFFWAILALRRFKTVPYLRRAAAVVLVGAIAFAASYYAKTHPQQLAVASESRVPVRYGTSASETVRFELYEGDRVLVDGREGDWARVVTADGERGWAEAGRLTFVGPPYVRGPMASAPATTQDAGATEAAKATEAAEASEPV